MKKLVLKGAYALGLGLLLTSGAMAQQTTQQKQQQATEQKAERMTQDLKKQLNLNEQQTNQVAEINRRLTQEMQQVRDNNTLTKQERKEQLLQIQNRRTAEINALLTEQQRIRYEEHQQKMRQNPAKQQKKQQPKPKNKSGKRGGN